MEGQSWLSNQQSVYLWTTSTKMVTSTMIGYVMKNVMKRNTPDPGCRLSPAGALFGHQLRDFLPFIKKGDSDIFTNTQFSEHWRKAW